ncbi:hypothetical protein ACJJTC_012486 [Scirpophaga incertulas]
MLTAVETSGDKSWQDALGEVHDVETEVDIEEVREEASRSIQKAAAYDKARFDSTKAPIKRFSVNDFVLLENEERNQTKLDRKYKGPYRVVEILDGDRYTLKALIVTTPWCKWSWWTVVSRCSCLSFGSRLIHEGVYKQDGRVGNGTPVRVDRAVGNGTPVRLDRAVGNGTPVRLDRARRSLRRSGRL